MSFWRGRRVFLTGHTGFKGSWLTQWLKIDGARVTGYSLAPPTQPSLFEAADVAARASEAAEGLTELERATRELEQIAGMLRDLTRGFASVV